MRILKNNLASFHLYHADCIGVESNCLYPHAVEVPGGSWFREIL